MTSTGGYRVSFVYKMTQELSHKVADTEWVNDTWGSPLGHEFRAEVSPLWQPWQPVWLIFSSEYEAAWGYILWSAAFMSQHSLLPFQQWWRACSWVPPFSRWPLGRHDRTGTLRAHMAMNSCNPGIMKFLQKDYSLLRFLLRYMWQKSYLKN